MAAFLGAANPNLFGLGTAVTTEKSAVVPPFPLPGKKRNSRERRRR
jgi:hypothetical protein